MICVQFVSKRFGDFEALGDVSLEVPEGSLTALLGPSGSGKATLLRIIGGLESPDAGRVVIGGEDVTGVPPQRRGIGFVFQHYAAFRHMTVRDNVAFGLHVRKQPKARVQERTSDLLGIVGLAATPTATPTSSPAGSASAWRSRARSRSSRACCCSTSRSARWTRRSARSCASGCAACTRRSR